MLPLDTVKTKESKPASRDVQVGRRIQDLRKKRGILQMELARKVGISAAALSNFEKGRRRASIAWLTRVARALGAGPADLVPGSRDRRPLARSAEEESLVAAWRRLSADPQLQDALLSFLETLAQRPAPGVTRGSP